MYLTSENRIGIIRRRYSLAILTVMAALTPTKVEELSFSYSESSFKLIRPSEYACINTSSTSFISS